MSEKPTLLPSKLEMSRKRMGAPISIDDSGRKDERIQWNSLRIAKRIVRQTECVEEVIEAKWSE